MAAGMHDGVRRLLDNDAVQIDVAYFQVWAQKHHWEFYTEEGEEEEAAEKCFYPIRSVSIAPRSTWSGCYGMQGTRSTYSFWEKTCGTTLQATPWDTRKKGDLIELLCFFGTIAPHCASAIAR